MVTSWLRCKSPSKCVLVLPEAVAVGSLMATVAPRETLTANESASAHWWTSLWTVTLPSAVTTIAGPTPASTVGELVADTPPSAPDVSAAATRRLDGIDLLSTLAATLLAGLLGFWLGQQFEKPLPRQVRSALWILIAGLSAYLLYGSGLLRPEQWLFDEPDVLTGRLSVAGLAFLFGLVAMGLNSQPLGRRSPRRR